MWPCSSWRARLSSIRRWKRSAFRPLPMTSPLSRSVWWWDGAEPILQEKHPKWVLPIWHWNLRSAAVMIVMCAFQGAEASYSANTVVQEMLQNQSPRPQVPQRQTVVCWLRKEQQIRLQGRLWWPADMSLEVLSTSYAAVLHCELCYKQFLHQSELGGQVDQDRGRDVRKWH